MLSNGSRISYVVELWNFSFQSCPTLGMTGRRNFSASLEYICSTFLQSYWVSHEVLRKTNRKSALTLPIEQSWPVQLGSQLQSPVSGRKVPWPEHWSRQVALGVSQFVPPQPTEQWHSPRTHTPRPEQVGSMQSTTWEKEEEVDRESKWDIRKKAIKLLSKQTYLHSISRFQPKSPAVNKTDASCKKSVALKGSET